MATYLVDNAGELDVVRCDEGAIRDELRELYGPDALRDDSIATWRVADGQFVRATHGPGGAEGIVADEDVPSVVRAALATAAAGSRGGAAKSKAKVNAAKANGAKGGRPSNAVLAVRAARSLEELRDVLNGQSREERNTLSMDQEMSQLPTFGGAEPRDTREVWSWDETRLLVGQSVPFEIVPRK